MTWRRHRTVMRVTINALGAVPLQMKSPGQATGALRTEGGADAFRPI